jgi:hypothetical protein
MHVNFRSRLLAGAAVAFALSAWACSNTSRDTYSATGTSGTAAEQSVNLTGCVQQTGGLTGDYILTEVNSQNRPVGTSGTAPGGSSATGDLAAREQQAAASLSYRLDGDNSQLRDLVGKQVQVTGRVTEQGKVASSNPSGTPSGAPTPGTPRDMTDNPQGKPAYPSTPATATPNISASDLARVKIDSITKVSESCGSAAAK